METNVGQIAPAAEHPQLEEASRLARIGGMLRSGYESARNNARVYAALGASALALYGGAKLMNSESAAAAADPTPIEQTCAEPGTAPMAVVNPYMVGARKKHGAGWSGFIGLKAEALPDECAENDYYRLTNSRILMQDGKHRKRWIYIQRAPGDNDGLGLASNEAGSGGLPFYNINYEHDHSWTKYNYVCSPGPKKTKVRYQQVNTLVHVDGKVDEIGLIQGDYDVVAGPHVTNHPVKVYGAC